MIKQSKPQNKKIKGFIFAVSDMVTYGLLPLLLKLKLKNQENDLFSQKFAKPLIGIAVLATVGSFFFFCWN